MSVGVASTAVLDEPTALRQNRRMRSRAELAVATLASARQIVSGNVAGLTIEQALHSAGGHRSALGILKHLAAWSHVYRSFAFDDQPTHWRMLAWPRGLRDTIEPSQSYLDELIAWFNESATRWQQSLSGLDDEEFDRPLPCHWGATAPLFDIVLMVADHWCYHAGELNLIISVARGEAWELSEEVEENHISTAGHRVRPNWMSDEQAQRYEAFLALRDAQLHPS
jgi:hypothetical protein